MIRERDVERLLVKRCKERGWLCWKFVSPGLRGVPDRVVLMPGFYYVTDGNSEWKETAGGVIEFIELKAPGEKPTAAQQRRHAELRAAGFTVTVLDSKEAVEAWAGGS